MLTKFKNFNRFGFLYAKHNSEKKWAWLKHFFQYLLSLISMELVELKHEVKQWGQDFTEWNFIDGNVILKLSLLFVFH